MEARKFTVGDRVRVHLDSYASDNPADVYTISRALPALANVWQYRVKRVGDGLERAVNEVQLAKSALQASATLFMAASATRSPAESQEDRQRIRNVRATERARVKTKRSELER